MNIFKNLRKKSGCLSYFVTLIFFSKFASKDNTKLVGVCLADYSQNPSTRCLKKNLSSLQHSVVLYFLPNTGLLFLAAKVAGQPVDRECKLV